MAKGIRNNAGYDYMVMSTQGLNEFKDNTANLPLFTEIENGKTPGSIATYNPSWRSRQNEVNDEIKMKTTRLLHLSGKENFVSPSNRIFVIKGMMKRKD